MVKPSRHLGHAGMPCLVIIERAFRDFADDIAKDPRFEGAYVGNRPDAKPENYDNRAIPIDEFIAVVAEGIAEHNARLGRRSASCRGRSFDATFAESYAVAKIRKRSDEQRRLWLMGQEVRKLHKGSGRLSMHGNSYWSDWMNELAGRSVVARFDAEDLHAGLYIYDLAGAFLGFAACEEKAGFFDLNDAKDQARKVSAYKRAERNALQKHRALSVKEIAAGVAETAREAAPVLPETKVVQGVFGRQRAKAPLVQRPRYQEAESPADARQHVIFMRKYQQQQKRQAEVPRLEETPRQRFDRASALEQKMAAGVQIGEAEHRWLSGYRTSSEYRAEKSDAGKC